MPWYKLPHANLVMHFDQEMDLEPADEPFATGGVVEGPIPELGDVTEVVIPNVPEPTGAHVWGTGPGVTFDADPRLVPAPEEEAEAT